MTEDNVMKIADFGLARDIHHIDYYKKTTNVSGGRGALWGGRGQRWGCPQPVLVMPRVFRAVPAAPW